MVVLFKMAKTVKVYQRKGITHVPYNGAFYALQNPPGAEPHVSKIVPGTRVSIALVEDGVVAVRNIDGTGEFEYWALCSELTGKKAPKAKASASTVAHVVTVEEALNVLREAGYEIKEKTVAKTAHYPSQIERAILSGNWTYDQVKQMAQAISKAGDHIAENARYEFRPGDHIEWTGKRGYVRRGTVKSIGSKNAKIEADDCRCWRVYLGYLRKAS